ncbi:AT-rich interactive domain-containing protein 2-like [Hordeum vulgare]|uniref:ELM2 domain-containing protein n=1 Tax=Hordeum vulgare subsp. vulgare TaxID=112509 RepID=A0A8I6XAV0_HORVV|nr:AT-rich interactive domain-containing protein 2-like [Hordeum vulgare subsp. vulgare]KAE8782694.1 AT-rich interactive domain-containing protein 2-like [Hordeum vulgare]
MDLSAASALAVLSKLQLLGFCAGLQIPDDAADPSEVFDAILAAFLREVYPGERDARPLPASLGDGRCVDLLRLFTAVRAAGGYAVASSPSAGVWAAAAGSAALAAPVKLLYAKYLGALERWIQRLPEAQPPPAEEMRQELLCVFGANGVEMEEPSMDCNGRGRKRKMEDMAGMLDWVRGLAETVSEEGAIAAGLADGYFPVALAAREAVARKRVRRASVTSGAFLQEIGCRCCRSITCARIGVQCSKKLQLVVQQPGSDTNKLTAVVESMNGSSMVIESESNLNGQSKHSANRQRNKLLVGSNYQAVVPQWTGVLPENYSDPETLKWLGTKIWPPENQHKIAPVYCDPIGRGREDVCSCNIPRSVECVRFHIAERRLQLRRELGSAFYGWGFDSMGEEVALSWTDEEEASFKAVMQVNAPSSGRNLLNHLHSSLRWKRRKELVSYYFNCFLLRRRCYQNRITPKKIDSDDEEETEFRFLGNRMGQSATKYDSTKRTVCIQSSHCMDLDQ